MKKADKFAFLSGMDILVLNRVSGNRSLAKGTMAGTMERGEGERLGEGCDFKRILP